MPLGVEVGLGSGDIVLAFCVFLRFSLLSLLRFDAVGWVAERHPACKN